MGRCYTCLLYTSPGDYTLQFGLYDRATGARWPLLGPDGQPAADRLLLMTNDE